MGRWPLAAAAIAELERGGEQPMHDDVGIAADGGREMGVLGDSERVVRPHGPVFQLPRAEVLGQLQVHTHSRDIVI